MKVSPGKIFLAFVALAVLAVSLSLLLKERAYRSFADYPGFDEYYGDRCSHGPGPPAATGEDRKLLERFRPRLVLSPGGHCPIDFYRDYLPFASMRRFPERTLVSSEVTPALLRENRKNRNVYLDFDFARFQAAGNDRRASKDRTCAPRPVVYGRVYRERVFFPCEDGSCPRNFVFLKYNIVFPVSGLPVELPPGYGPVLRSLGLDPEDWHELDNFAAVHIVLDEYERPVAALLAQHNHHRTHLAGKDLPLPPDERMVFAVARRSNEVYPASNSPRPARHRAVRRAIHLKYLLSGKDPPLMRGHDLTWGLRAGGKELEYGLAFLSPCDPFYTAEILLGEPRPFLGRYIGRDGPPGADYYTVPRLLPLGKLLKFSYLHDDDPGDIQVVDEAIDMNNEQLDIEKIMEHGGRKFYRDLRSLERD